MKIQMFPILLVLLPSLGPAETPLHVLTIAANTPSIKVMPRAPGRSFLALPQLDYQFVLQPGCAENWLPAGLSLSIADSRISIAPTASSAQSSAIEAQLTVPAAQLAPVPLSGFCETVDELMEPGQEAGTGPTADTAVESFIFKSALSVHAALICASEDQRRITYVSKPLDIRLICEL